jgi:hypothetical protein
MGDAIREQAQALAGRAHNFFGCIDDAEGIRKVAGWIEEQIRAAADGARRAAAACADQWSKPQVVKLAAGEMTAQELRTAQAVAKGIAAAIRSLSTPPQPDPVSAAREALRLAEDVLSRFPYSSEIWPNGMHPHTGISQIRDAIAGLETKP